MVGVDRTEVLSLQEATSDSLGVSQERATHFQSPANVLAKGDSGGHALQTDARPSIGAMQKGVAQDGQRDMKSGDTDTKVSNAHFAFAIPSFRARRWWT